MSKYEQHGERHACVVDNNLLVDLCRLAIYVTDPTRPALKHILDQEDSIFSGNELLQLRLAAQREL